MNKDRLIKALLKGIPTGIASWLIYGLVFQTLIDHKPISEGLFGRDSLVFLAVVTVVEIVLYYITDNKKSGTNE